VIEPYYAEKDIVIFHGDCRDVLPELEPVDCVITDPPYGMNCDTDNSRFTNRKGSQDSPGVGAGVPIVGDDRPFDPSPWLEYPRVVLFGCNHFAARLPVGSTLVWIKRFDPAFGSFLSDAELAWMKGGHGVYCFRDLSMNGEARHRKHPTQKPLPLMLWCIEKAGGDGTILDPFMGSGTTLVAAKELGRRAIGIEIEEKYCEIAVKRLAQEVLPL